MSEYLHVSSKILSSSAKEDKTMEKYETNMDEIGEAGLHEQSHEWEVESRSQQGVSREWANNLFL